MAEQFLDFIWDETKGGWVPFGQSAISVARNQVFPREIINIANSTRISQFGLEVLRIPAKSWQQEGGKQQFVGITPISPEEEPDTKLKIEDIVEKVPNAAAAYERWRTSEAPLQVRTPGEPGLVTSRGIKTEGVGKGVKDFVKGLFKTNAIPVEINAPLPGDPEYIVPGGLATTGVTPSTTEQQVATTAPTFMADLPALQGRTVGKGVPMRPTVGATIGYQTILPNLDEDDRGVFTFNGVDSILLPQRNSQLSTPVNLNTFENVTLYNLPSEEVVQYQKQFKLKETGRMDSALATKITERAKAASLENIRRLNPDVQDKTQVSWEDAALGIALSSGAGGTGAIKGPTPEQIKAYTRSVKIKSNELGVDLDEATLRGIVNSFARGEITSENLDEVIVRRGTIDFGQPLKGAVAEQMAALKQSAAAYGIQYNDDWYRTSILNVLKGKADVETYNQQIKDLAKSQYPTLAAQIDAGYTVQSIASPYISTMSQILELNPGEITLYDDTIRRALTGINDQNQPSLKPLWEFERDLKKDERWRYTKNAEQDLMGTGIKLLRSFGLVS